MLGNLFNYIETIDETNYSISHLKRYYQKINCELKSEYVQGKNSKIPFSTEKYTIFE